MFKILFQLGRQYSIFLKIFTAGAVVKAAEPLRTWGRPKVAEIHRKLDLVKFLLITTIVIIEVSR